MYLPAAGKIKTPRRFRLLQRTDCGAIMSPELQFIDVLHWSADAMLAQV